MLNEPPPDNQTEQPKKNRRPHPLAQRPEPPHPSGDPAEGQQGQMVTLHIPVVPPYVTYILVGINSVIFFIAFYVLSPAESNNLYSWGANNHNAVLNFGEYHRLFTSMFLHGGLVHLVFNMYALYVIGQTVERFFGHARFALVYFLGGLGGSILSVVLNDPLVRSVGASGAVFAIFGAEMVFLYKHRKLLGRMAQVQLRQLVIIAGINFLYGFATTLDPSGINIDNWGHIGGFIGGMVLSWFIAPLLIPKRHPTDERGLAIDDINPLQTSSQYIFAYVSGLLFILLAAIYLM